MSDEDHSHLFNEDDYDEIGISFEVMATSMAKLFKGLTTQGLTLQEAAVLTAATFMTATQNPPQKESPDGS